MENISLLNILVSTAIPAIVSVLVAFFAYREKRDKNRTDSYERTAARNEERLNILETRNDEQDREILELGQRVSVLSAGIHILTSQLVMHNIEPAWRDPGEEFTPPGPGSYPSAN